MSINDNTNEDEIFTEVRRSRRRSAARPRHTGNSGTAAGERTESRYTDEVYQNRRAAAGNHAGSGPVMTEETLIRHTETAGGYEERVRNMTERTDPSHTNTRRYETQRNERPVQRHENGRPAHANESVRRETPKKKHPMRLILIGLFLLLLSGAAYAGWRIFKGAGHTAEPGYYTVAVFGVDSRNGSVGKEVLSDVNVLARFNMETGEIRLVSLYRDTYSQISEDGTFHKLNEAYFRGGPEQAVWAVEHNTDVKVDDYATFNWKAIADAINILGGIDIEISDSEFRYINAYITETVNSTGVGSYQLEHAGMNHLDGVQAVAYARLRLMDTDFNRTERQRKVVKLAFEKAKAADFLTLNNILVTVMPQISTSVTVDDMLPFARNIYHFYIGETAGFPFDLDMQDVGKLDCVIPVTLESNARALHEFLYPDKAYEPSELLKQISERIISDTGLGGNGSTEVRTDKPSSGSGQSFGSQAAPAETAPAETGESVSTEETSETETEESTEETGETDENGNPVSESSEGETEETKEDVVVSPAITNVTPELISAPEGNGPGVTGGSGSSIDDAVIVSPASGQSQGPGPGGSSGAVPTAAAGPGGGSANVYEQDSPGAVSEGPGIAATDDETAAGPGPADNAGDGDSSGDAGASEAAEQEAAGE